MKIILALLSLFILISCYQHQHLPEVRNWEGGRRSWYKSERQEGCHYGIQHRKRKVHWDRKALRRDGRSEAFKDAYNNCRWR